MQFTFAVKTLSPRLQYDHKNEKKLHESFKTSDCEGITDSSIDCFEASMKKLVLDLNCAKRERDELRKHLEHNALQVIEETKTQLYKDYRLMIRSMVLAHEKDETKLLKELEEKDKALRLSQEQNKMLQAEKECLQHLYKEALANRNRIKVAPTYPFSKSHLDRDGIFVGSVLATTSVLSPTLTSVVASDENNIRIFSCEQSKDKFGILKLEKHNLHFVKSIFSRLSTGKEPRISTTRLRKFIRDANILASSMVLADIDVILTKYARCKKHIYWVDFINVLCDFAVKLHVLGDMRIITSDQEDSEELCSVFEQEDENETSPMEAQKPNVIERQQALASLLSMLRKS